jgi:hypothetical protein
MATPQRACHERMVPRLDTRRKPGASARSAALTSQRKGATADRRQQKTPTSGGWGHAPWLLHWRPSPRKAPQQKAKQVSWLAALVYSLRLPKASHLSGQCRFRSAYSCGAAMASHHLPCSHTARVSSPTSVLCNSLCELTAVLPVLSRTFLQRAPWQARGAVGRPSPQSAGVIFRSSLH